MCNTKYSSQKATTTTNTQDGPKLSICAAVGSLLFSASQELGVPVCPQFFYAVVSHLQRKNNSISSILILKQIIVRNAKPK